MRAGRTEGAVAGSRVASWLRARGLQVVSARSPGLQVDRGPGRPELLCEGLDGDRLAMFYRLLRRYSFRMLLREILGQPGAFRLEDVNRYGSHGSTERQLQALERIGLVVREGNLFTWRGETPDSFGPTLEWFVAEVVRRELQSDALHAVRLGGLRGGGDYDVVGLWGGRLLYIETKAGPPKAIDEIHVRLFLERVRTLAPEIAVFLIDTHLRMTDKMVPLFRRQLTGLFGNGAPRGPSPVARGVYHVGDTLFITNTKRGVDVQILSCLWWYLKHRVGALPSDGEGDG